MRTLYPNVTITDVNNPILRPDVIADSLGNLGVAVLSAAGRAELTRLRDSLLAGSTFLVDVSFRYQVPLGKGFNSLDLFYDIFNITNRTNEVPPTGNRASANFMIATAAQFPSQMQFGVRVRF